MTTEVERYFRDIYDHLIRISDLIDTYRDLLTSSMDVFLSTVSNRLNVVMKQLAVITTIFFSLTFVTGFFGQNFGWLVKNIAGWPAFVLLGIGTEVVAVAILVTFFKRRGFGFKAASAMFLRSSMLRLVLLAAVVASGCAADQPEETSPPAAQATTRWWADHIRTMSHRPSTAGCGLPVSGRGSSAISTRRDRVVTQVPLGRGSAPHGVIVGPDGAG